MTDSSRDDSFGSILATGLSKNIPERERGREREREGEREREREGESERERV
jgi:hypothetical protein